MGEYDLQVLDRFITRRHAGGRYPLLWLIAVSPRSALNMLTLLFCLIFRPAVPYTIYNLVITNPSPHFANWVAALFGQKFAVSRR